MKYKENCLYCVDLGGVYKIGFTSRLGDRLRAYQAAHKRACYPVVLIYPLSRAKARELEAKVADALGDYLMSNEIYNASLNQIREVFLRVQAE